MSPEQLEKRQMMAVEVFGDATLNGGWLTIVAEGGDDVFIQKVATAPESLWVADNSSFANQITVGAIDSLKSIFITSGTQRQESEVQFTGYPMTAESITRFSLPSDGLETNGDFENSPLLLGLLDTPLSGSVSILQPDGQVSSWSFNNSNVEQFGTVRALGSPRFVSGVGFDSVVPAGYYYPLTIRALGGPSATSKSQIEVQWNVPRLPTAPTLNVNEWYRLNSIAFPADGSQAAVVDLGPAAPSTTPLGSLMISLPDAAGAGLNPIIPSTFFGELIVDGVSFRITAPPNDVGTQRFLSDRNTTLLFNGRPTGTWRNGASTYSVSGVLRTGDAGNPFNNPDGILRGLRLQMSGEFPVVLSRARYAVTTNDSPVSATIFAGHDIKNELTVNLLAPGSTFNVDSKVEVVGSGLELRATNINFNSTAETTSRIGIGAASESQYRAREQAEALAEIVNGRVTNLVLPAGLAGAGYDVARPPTVTISAPQSTQARAVLRSLAGGEVRSISVTAGGTGYAVPPIVRITPPQAVGGQAATATATIVGGVVTSVVVTNPGSGYTSAPVVTFEAVAGGGGGAGGGVGAVGTGAQASANIVGPLGEIFVISGGSGYTPNSVVPVTVRNAGGGAGSGATARGLTNSSGVVYSIEILNAGSGYSLDATDIVIDTPPPLVNPDVARAVAIVDPRTSRIQGFRITNPGSGYSVPPEVLIASPPAGIGEVRPLGVAETVLFNAGVAANIFDIQVADDPGTTDVLRSRLLVSSSAALTRNLETKEAARSVVVDAQQGDIFVAGSINATDQSYRLLSFQNEQELAPFFFSTSAYATGAQTGQIIGDTVAVTLANDLETPLTGAFAQNDLSLRTNVNSIRIRAARRDGRPIDDPFPYRLEINEAEDIGFDAVAASSFPIVINGSGAIALRSAIQTAGGMKITTSGDFRTSAPVATTQGKIEVTARSLAVTNTLDVTAAARDLTGGTTDITLTANGGRLVLAGDVSAVNDVRLVQRDPPAARITGFAASDGNTLVRTASPHLLQQNTFVTIAGTVSYDGAWRIVRVPSATSFEIARAFVSNETTGTASPTASIPIVGFAASAGNTLVRLGSEYGLQVGDPVTITGTTNYNGTYAIAAVGSATTFDIPRQFIANDVAGTAVLPAAGSLFGAGRVSGIGLVVEADGNVSMRTDVRTADVRSLGSVSLEEMDDLRLTRLVASGRAAINAAGIDPGVSGYNPIALKVDDVTGISTLEVSAPNGSVDVTVNTSKSTAIGGAVSTVIPNMQAAGDVRIRSTAGALNVYDAPLAGGNARSVRAATSGPLLAQYDPGIARINAGELRGNGVINATGLFDGVTNLSVGDRVLVREGSTSAGVTTSESNGVYVVAQVGGGFGTTAQWRLTRALDSSTTARMPSNAVVRVGEGTQFANTFHRIRYASIPSDVAQFVAANAFQLPVDYPGFEMLGPGQPVTGPNFAATIVSIDSSNGVVKLDAATIPLIAGTNVRGAGLVEFPTAALGFDEILVEPVVLTTNIGTDPFNTTSFIVSSTGGTNADAGSLGKMLLLRQANDTSAEPLNPIQRMAFGFGNLAGPIRLTQELPLVVTPIAIDGSSRFAVPSAVGVPFAPVVVDGSRIVTNREGSPVRVVRGTPETVNGFEFTDGSAAVGLAAGASLTNVTIGGFAAGAAVKIDGVNGILLNALSVGRSESGDRLANKIGIQVAGDGAAATVVSSTVVASNQVGIQVDADAAGITVVGTSIGTVGQGNAYGLDLKGGYNQIGVVRVPTGIRKSQAVFNGTTLPIPAKILSVVPSPLYLGQSVGGTGIAPGTTIAAINGGTITLSKPMTMTRATNLVFGQPKRNSVQGNLFGAAISGGINVVRNTDFGNNTYDGINVTGGTNFIGTSPKRDATSNAFFGNGRWGVHLSAAAKATAQILGNFFGTIARATAGQANGSGSVAIEGQPDMEHTPAFSGIRKVTTDRFGNQHVMPILRRGLAGTKSSTVVPPKQSWR